MSDAPAKPANPVSKEARDLCYKRRDVFFECADAAKASGVAGKCDALKVQYEGACLPSWIKHFEQRRGYERERDARIKAIEEEDRRTRGK